MMDPSHLKLAASFFSQFVVVPLDSTSYLLTSQQSSLLVRTHLIDSDDSETLQEVISTLDQHLSYDHQHVAPLLHFQKCPEGIRSFYTVDGLNLRDEVQQRSQQDRPFTEQELWVLLSSVVDSLLYLQAKGTIYGVLSSKKIFMEGAIRLMNPSAFTLAPVNVSRISFQSPQIAATDKQIDFNQSDVYLLGLCILEAAALTKIDNKVNKDDVQRLLEDVRQQYSSQMVHVLQHMLKEQAEDRPSFTDIQEYIQKEIQIKSTKTWAADTLPADCEDTPSQLYTLACSLETERPDYLEPIQQSRSRRKESEYQRAKAQFFETPCLLKQTKNLPPTTYRSKQSKKSSIQQQKMRKRTQGRVQSVQEFKITVVETINKKKKRPRAVEIKNRNAQEVKKVQSFRYQDRSDGFSTDRMTDRFKSSRYTPVR